MLGSNDSFSLESDSSCDQVKNMFNKHLMESSPGISMRPSNKTTYPVNIVDLEKLEIVSDSLSSLSSC